MSEYHIAQLNLAKMRAPIDDPLMAEFVENLERINKLGDNTPGCVWRLEADLNETTIPYSDDAAIITNLTVWQSIEALHQFTYYSTHTDFYRRRLEWFEKMETPSLVLWWVPAGHIPTVDEAKEQLELLTSLGPTPLAFTFKNRFSIEELLAYQAEGAK